VAFDEDLIGRIYDAPFTEDGWEHVASALEKPFGVKSGYLCLVDRASGDLCFTKSANFSADVNAEYVETYSAFDPAPAWAMKHGHEKLLFSDADFGADARPEKNPYYQWFAKANDTSFRFGAHAVTRDDMVLALTFHRLSAKGPVSAEDLERFRPLARHIVRALELQYRLGVQDERVQALISFYDRSEDAILFLDRSGKLTFANAATERLAAAQAEAAGLDPVAFRLKHLPDARGRAALAAATGAVPMPQTLSAARPSGRRDYIVQITPLGAGAMILDPKAPRIAVQIADPERETPQPEAWLVQSYGFTPAEARLAAALVGGMSLREASDTLGVAYSAVRSQLRSVFAKTGVNRQAELIRMLTMLR